MVGFVVVNIFMLIAGLSGAVPILLGLVPGPLLEDNLVQSLQLALGSILPFITRPITVTFFILSILSLLFFLFNLKKAVTKRS